MKLKITHQRKKKNFKNKKKSKKKKLYYECEKTNYFVKNCCNKNVMSQRQINITLKKIFEIDDVKKIVNETIIEKINLNNEYCIIDNKTKLQKIINAASNKTKHINFKIEEFKRSSTFYLDCTKVIFKWNLKYD